MKTLIIFAISILCMHNNMPFSVFMPKAKMLCDLFACLPKMGIIIMIIIQQLIACIAYTHPLNQMTKLSMHADSTKVILFPY